MTIIQKLCKNIVFNTSRTCFGYLLELHNEAILKNIQTNKFCGEIRIKQALSHIISQSGSEVIKLFSCSTQLIMKFSLLINMKMPTIVGIFIFISREIFMLSYV